MVRLRTVSPNSPGWSRRRAGQGFAYRDQNGRPLPPEDVQRIRSLVIPPAWKDVWICPAANGHIQAVGTDDAGRRQYLYHPDWRVRRDRLKFDRVLKAAAALPKARQRIAEDLARSGMPQERALAAAVRLLDLGYFRIGSDTYTDANGSFGLTTMERRHVRKAKGAIVFRFVGKSGVEHEISIDDTDVIAALDRMRGRRSRSQRLLAFQRDTAWVDLDAAAVNAYLSEVLGGDLTAKDFRTWHATVIAAAALATTKEDGATAASRRRAVKEAVLEVSRYLGNTPAIAKSSYIDPRILDLYEAGKVIVPPGPRVSAARRQQRLEQAVQDLLS